MKYIIVLLFLFTLNCSTNKVSKNHGYRLLEKKYETVEINKYNKNDILSIIGPPSSKSNFNNNKWFYIERKNTNQSLTKLGIKKIEKNNILIIEFDKKGIVKNKKLLNIEDMNEINFVKSITTKDFEQNNFLYNVFSSLREKINAPTRKSRLKNK